MSKLSENFQLEQAIGMHINRAAFLMTEEIASRFAIKGFPLAAQDFGIMLRLSQQGAMTQIEIANMLMRDKTTITRRIDGLVKKQLVTRKPDENDRRYFRINLTAQGEQALDTLLPLVRDFQEEVLCDIPAEHKNITIQTLKHISEKLLNIKDMS